MPRKTPTPADLDAGYCRVSEVDVQEGRGEAGTIEQLVAVRTKELRDAAARDGRTISDELMYIDMGISGTTVAKRSGMTRLIQDAKAGKFARVWFRNLSRIFRNLEEQIAYIRQIEDAGVKILSLQEPNEGEKAMLDYIRNIMGATNQFYAACVGDQVRANNRTVASMGRCVSGNPPLGYRYDKEIHELLPDPIRSADAVTVFRTYCEDGTFCGTAKILNGLGIRTRLGAQWRHRKVKDILTNPLYRGLVHYNGETWPGLHETIIPEHLLRRTDELLAIAAARPARPQGDISDAGKRTYSGLLTCGLCGDSLRFQPNTWGDHSYAYWVCSARKDEGTCDAPTYRTEELDMWVLEGLELALTHELSAIQEYAQNRPQQAARPQSKGDDVQGQIAAIQAKMNKIAMDYAEGWMPQDQCKLLMSQYQRAIENLKSLEQESPAQKRRVTAADIKQFRDTIDAEWEKMDEPTRRRLVALLAPQIQVYPDRLILRTCLSIGDITIPTGMFERTGDTEPNRGRIATDDENGPWRCAPGRTSGGTTTRARWRLTKTGKAVRFPSRL